MRKISRIKLLGAALMGFVLAGSFAALDAQAQNIVYNSPGNNGVNPGAISALPIGPFESLFLYLDTGSAISQNGTPCDDGDGREVCGYEVVIDALGTAFFSDFLPEPGVVFKRTGNNHYEINGLFALNPASGAVRIGQFVVVNNAVDGSVMAMGGQVVLAALQVESISQSLLAAPEPGGWLPLMAGAVFLLGLQHRRWGRRVQTDCASEFA